MLRTLLFLTLASFPAFSANLSIPIDSDQFQQANSKLIALAQNGEDAAVLVQGRRTLEVLPNEPTLQAPVYLLMSVAARHLGENARAHDYATAAHALDPSLGSPTSGTPATRGGTGDAIQQAIGVASQSLGAYQQIKMMQLCLEMVKHNLTPPPQCGAQQGGIATQQGMPPQNMPPQNMQPPQPGMPMTAPPQAMPPPSMPQPMPQSMPPPVSAPPTSMPPCRLLHQRYLHPSPSATRPRQWARPHISRHPHLQLPRRAGQPRNNPTIHPNSNHNHKLGPIRGLVDRGPMATQTTRLAAVALEAMKSLLSALFRITRALPARTISINRMARC